MKSAPSRHPPKAITGLHRATVAVGFVTGLLSGARTRGVDPARLLARAGIDPGVLRERAGRVPIGNYAALYNLAVAEMADEAFGLLSRPLEPGAFEFLCRCVLSSPDLGTALRRAGAYLAVALPDLHVTIDVAGDKALLAVEERSSRLPRDDPRRVFAFEWLLRLLHALSCWLVERPVPLDEVRFPYRSPGHAADYALIYTPRATFGAKRLEAVLEGAMLALPVRRGEGDLPTFLEGAPGRITMLYRRDREVAGAVRDHLSRHLAEGPGLDATAAALHLAPRTLHRRLRHEGTSFREIRDALRRELALAWLSRKGRSIAQVALALGYSEPSAFFRAFQGWAGVAPSAYRSSRLPK